MNCQSTQSGAASHENEKSRKHTCLQTETDEEFKGTSVPRNSLGLAHSRIDAPRRVLSGVTKRQRSISRLCRRVTLDDHNFDCLAFFPTLLFATSFASIVAPSRYLALHIAKINASMYH